MTTKIIVITGISIGMVIAMFIGGWLLDRPSTAAKDPNKTDK